MDDLSGHIRQTETAAVVKVSQFRVIQSHEVQHGCVKIVHGDVALDGTVADVIGPLEFSRSKGEYTRLVDENIQARIRFSDILSGIAAKHDLLFTNNGNKTELALGYTTLYGDLSGADGEGP